MHDETIDDKIRIKVRLEGKTEIVNMVNRKKLTYFGNSSSYSIQELEGIAGKYVGCDLALNKLDDTRVMMDIGILDLALRKLPIDKLGKTYARSLRTKLEESIQMMQVLIEDKAYAQLMMEDIYARSPEANKYNN